MNAKRLINKGFGPCERAQQDDSNDTSTTDSLSWPPSTTVTENPDILPAIFLRYAAFDTIQNTMPPTVTALSTHATQPPVTSNNMFESNFMPSYGKQKIIILY